jgi:ATP-binding cassette, subfamily B, multidrug efflux pump
LVLNLLGLLRPWRGRLTLVGVAILAAAAFEVIPPLVIRKIVDAHLAVRQPNGLLFLACLYLAAASAVHVTTFLYNYLAATIAQGVLSELRVRLFAHVQRLPTSYFDRFPIGDIISRCTADLDTLDAVFSSSVAVLLANLVRLGTIGVAMLALSVPLTLVAALVVPPLALLTRLLQVRMRRAERDNRIAVGAINTRLHEALRSIEVIRAFQREPEFVRGFRQALRRGLAASNRSTFFNALYLPNTSIVAAFAVAGLLWIGTQPMVATFGVSLGSLIAFLILIQRFFQPLTTLGEEWQTVQGAMAGGERVFATLALPVDGVPTEALPLDGAGQPAISLDHVEFGYIEGQRVLHAVSLQVKRGEHVALVGRTGAGKSSALHLAAGLYRPSRGTVRVVGRDPVSLHESERHRVLGVVPQMVDLFSGTVMDNLTLGDISVPPTAVYEACRLSGADGFIRALPGGYDTELSAGGGRGAHLSAGQRQLLALSRALVHEPAVLLLDEATAAIDGVSDRAFRASLRELMLRRGCSVLTVAHRLSTALATDRIIVLDKGHIVEEGTPADLAAAGGRFAALLELEAAGWDWRTSS